MEEELPWFYVIQGIEIWKHILFSRYRVGFLFRNSNKVEDYLGRVMSYLCLEVGRDSVGDIQV